VNEIKAIGLRKLMTEDIGWGVDNGREVHRHLERAISALPSCMVGIDLSGIRQADVSFSREAIVETLRRFRRSHQFVLVNPENEVVVENLEAALDRRGETVLLRERGGTIRPIGRELGPGLRPVLETVIRLGSATSRDVLAHHSGMSIQNASNKLKELWQSGLLRREEASAPSGGREWVYEAPG
jgi:hypothetical protein